MPQLDLMSFFTQFFWFSLSFTFFYIALVHLVIPSISLTLKFRKKRLEFLALDINKKKENVSSLLTTYDSVLSKAFNFSRSYLSKLTAHSNSWVNTNTLKIESSNIFSKANNLYLKSIAEKDFNFLILNNSLKNSVSDQYWTKLWTN